MDQFGITQEMLDVTDDEIQVNLEDLRNFKAELYSNLKNIRFKYDPARNNELVEAISVIYGNDFILENGYFVTFDMYVQMMEVVKAASVDKASQLLGDVL